MKVTYVADSTFLFEHDGIRILTDPWIGTTIYGGSWLQFPAPTIRPADIGRLDYIFISHIHEDHCDPATIAQLDRGAKILLLDRKPNYVAGFLHRHHFNFAEIINIAPYQSFQISPSLSVEMIDADPAHSLNHLIDSSMLVHWDGKTIFFANDNPPYPDSSKYLQRYRHELALIPASGGSGYPACYDSLSMEQKETERQRIVHAYFNIFLDTITTLQPKYFCAIAGNHVISGRNAVLNDQMTFLADPAIVYRHVKHMLSSEIVMHCAPLTFAEGQKIDLDAEMSVEGLWMRACLATKRKTQRDEFIHSVAAGIAYSHDNLLLPEGYDFPARFRTAGDKLFKMVEAADLRFNSHIYIELPTSGKKVLGHINGVERRVSIVENGHMLEPYFHVRTDDNLLCQLLEGQFSWNIADAGCLLRYRRVPNIYDREAFIALNFLRNAPPNTKAPKA